MEALFLQILNMSITASWSVLAVCVLRLVLKKAPKWVSAALWGLVAIRLVCPFSLESIFSLVPSAETVPSDIAMSRNPTVTTGVPALNSVINPVLQGSFTPEPSYSVNPLQVVNFIAAVVWIIGMVAMLLYAAISYIRLRKKTRESLLSHDNVYLCDRIDTPFILGLFKPRIYLPSDMDENDVEHVLAHEKAHLQRHDHWWKPFGFLLLTVYWFNPVLWLGYVLLCRDIELACDENVIRSMDVQNKKDYSAALVNCSVSRKSIAACPLAFGEVGVKNRIRTVLHYKKPALWILIAAVLVSLLAAVCLLTNPVSKELGGYSYRIGRYYYDNVIGKDRANREIGENTYEIDTHLNTVRYVEDRYHMTFRFVRVDEDTQKLQTALEAVLPFYYKWLQVEQVYYREGWDGALRAQGELNYFILQYSDGSLIGGYIGAYDEVPGQIYKLQRNGKYVEKPSRQTQKLTLQDVVSLSQKGAALTWSDFEQYDCVETGSGLYIRMYAIDEMFTLWVGGGSMDDTIKPVYIYLSAADSSEPSRIDIRKADVQAFINEHKNNPVVTNVTPSTWTVCDVVGNEKTFDAFCRQFGVPEKMQMSSQKYLPYAKIESVAQLQDFKTVMLPHMELDLKKQKGYQGSFKSIEYMFDDAFFEENVLLLFYTDCESVYSRFSMFEMTESQGVLSIVFGERVPAWCEPEGNGFLFCVMLARTQAEKISSYSATISAVYENQNEPQLPTEILLTEDMEWEFIHSGHIGIDVSIMKEISVDRTQNEHPVVQLTSEDELNSFALCMRTSVGRMVENLNLNAYGDKRFDKTFFEKNDLILVYLYAADLQTAYSFAGCTQNGTSLDLYFVRANPQLVSHVTSGWLLTLAVPKSITQNVTVACVVQNFKGYIEGSVKDFESLISGISTLEDVQSFAPNGEYLFLESGRGEPRVSTHFTEDNYVVSVEYDEHNIVTRVTKRTY